MDSKLDNYKVKFLFLIISVLLIWFFGRFFHIDVEGVRRSLEKFPLFYSGIIFVMLYVLVTFFIWFSKDVFRFAGAVLFGAYLSTLLVFISETINAFILFHFSRFLGRDYVGNWLKARYSNLDERLARLGFFWLFLFRSVPLVPFRFLDLACGLTRLSFKKYLTAVVLGSPIRIFWLQYILAGVGMSMFGKPYALAEYLLSNKFLFLGSFLYLILVIVVAVKLKFKD